MSNALKRHLFVLLAYTVITLVMTLPVALNLTTHLVGSGGDPWQTLWRFETKWQNFPQSLIDDVLGKGEPRLVNLSVWPWMPLHIIFGEPLGYNLVWLLSFILSGYGMYLLTSQLLANNFQFSIFNFQIPAFLAGLYYAFLPYHVAHSYGHFGAMQTQWLPLIILAALYFFRRPRGTSTLLLAALVIVQAWTEHHYALWLLVLAAVAFIYFRPKIKWQFAGWLAGLLIIGILLPYLPTLKLAQLDSPSLVLGQEQTIRFSADPFAFFIPAPFHPLWGKLADYLFAESYTGNLTEVTQFLGVIPLLLVIYFHQTIPHQQKKFWLIVAAIFFLISLGPRLHLLGRVTSLPLPWSLMDSWPVASAVRTVARAGTLVGLAASILLAWVLTMRLKRPASALAVGQLILLEFLFFPFPAQSAQLSPLYAAVKAQPGRALIEIPAATNYTIASRALYASVHHGKQVLGNIALERGATDAEQVNLRSVPGLRHVLYGGANRLLLDRPENDGTDMVQAFAESARHYDAHMVVIHTDSISARQLAALRHFFEDRLRLAPTQYDDALLYSFSL